jgi:hypothetical protein
LCYADEFVEEITAAGVENTREFSQMRFQEFLDRRILLLISRSSAEQAEGTVVALSLEKRMESIL